MEPRNVVTNLQAEMGVDAATAQRIVNAERLSQQNVANLGDLTSRRVVNLANEMGRPAGCNVVRAGIAIRFTDTETGQEKVWKQFVTLRQRGQLRSIMRQAINDILTNVLSKSYLPSFVSELDLGEGGDATLESLECF